jgi:hypothetical protein
MDNPDVVDPPAKRRKVECQDGLKAPFDTCFRCRLMFSPSGLRDLNSPVGYRHFNKRECAKSAQRGCSFCSMIVDHALKKWRPSHSLTFFTTLFYKPTWQMRVPPEDQLNATPVLFNGLSGYSLDAKKGDVIFSCKVYTDEGFDV